MIGNEQPEGEDLAEPPNDNQGVLKVRAARSGTAAGGRQEPDALSLGKGGRGHFNPAPAS